MIALQVDDSLGFGTQNFLWQEELEVKVLKYKERKHLDETELNLNGMTDTKTR